MVVYPQPGTMADRILEFIRDNPRVSTNRILTKLDLNPSPARKCIKALIERGLVTDRPDGKGNHHYTARSPKL